MLEAILTFSLRHRWLVVIASLLAQGYPPQTAAALGAYVHGRAGELAGSKMGRHGALASDVARAVAAALAELERG